MEARTGRGSDRRRVPSLSTPLRLDLLVNPFGPSLRVLEAIASSDDLHLPHEAQTERLRQRLAELHSVPANWIVIGNGIDELLVAALRIGQCSAVLFPPTDPEQCRLASLSGFEVVEVNRSHRFAIEVDPAKLELPRGAVSIAMSPNDPTGTILSPQEAVRLSRKSGLLVIDERHGAYSPRTLVPLVREFENVIVLRSFETWAGLNGLPIAYAIAPSKVAATLNAHRLRLEIAGAAVIAGHATLDDRQYVNATVERVREEKARLFRTLRKLNMIRPLPSWANFLLARVERGDADEFEAELDRREIKVHRPSQAALRQYFRISATTAEATAALKTALIDVAATL